MKYLTVLVFISCIPFFVSCNETQDGNSEETTEISQGNEKNNTEKPEVVEWNNTHCPVMEGKVKEDGGSTMYQGKLVRFCCPKCIKKFNDNPQEYHETLVSYASGKKPGEDAEDHGSHDH
ncbi:hypothetical protein [Candidatus Uabimicrobium sp. HlEnr_7]|uniref:hypothetical protein n=1 Tax=Candidatus Uabimicrobium helgolandensis TaxID=3095367 RepID=UPI0035571B53